VSSFAIVAAGISQLLAWLPALLLPVDPVSPTQLAGSIVGSGAAYAVSQLKSLPALRRRAAVDEAAFQWIKKFFSSAFTKSPARNRVAS